MKFGTKLTFIFTFIGFFSVLSGGIFLFYFFDGYLRDTTYRNLNKVAEIITFETDDFIKNSLESIKLIDIDKELAFNGEDDNEKEKVEEIDNQFHLIFQEVFILNEYGDVIGTTKKGKTENWASNPWFLKARDKEEIVVSDMYIVSDIQKPSFAIFYPQKDKEKEEIFFIVAYVNTENLFRKMNVVIGSEGGVFLLNSKNNIIYHPNKDYIFKKISDEYPFEKNHALKRGNIAFNFNKEDVVASFRVLMTEIDDVDLGWQLIVYQPKRDAFGFLEQMVISYMMLSFALILPIILAAFMISKKVIKPLNIITLSAQKIARGDFDTQIKVKSKDEFGVLANSFNKMADDLRKINKKTEEEKETLEIRIKARTKELNQLNRNLETQVQQRTEELEKKLREHEKMSKLMVGRELKMIELKKKIDDMEKTINELKNKKEV